MMTPAEQALREAGEFLDAHKQYSGDREVRCITPYSGEMPQLDLGTVRTLVALATAWEADHGPATAHPEGIFASPATDLASAAATVRDAPTGKRGRTLFECALILGIHGAAGEVTEKAAWDVLREAAVDYRMSEADAQRYFRDGWQKGLEVHHGTATH